MMNPRTTLLAAMLSFAVVLPGACSANYLYSHTTCDGAGMVTFTWNFVHEGADSVGPPTWTGWDVMRRRVGLACDSWVRVTAQPVPRASGSQQCEYSEPVPEQRTTYEYRAVPVDAARQPVELVQCWPCTGVDWVSCPGQSAALTVGTLTDWGWALYVQPCAESCYVHFYFEGAMVAQLRPYVGTGTVLRLYGVARCGTVEGCSMVVTGYDIGSCAPTSVSGVSWGRIKSMYR